MGSARCWGEVLADRGICAYGSEHRDSGILHILRQKKFMGYRSDMGMIQDLDSCRTRLGFTQKMVAQVMGVAEPMLSRAVRGNSVQEFVERYKAALDALSRAITPHDIAAIARPIAKEHFVEELYLFGSMARGEGRADSDIDFIYQLSERANPVLDLQALRGDLERAFGREVDLIRKDYLTKPVTGDELAEIQRVLFANSMTSQPMFRIV